MDGSLFMSVEKSFILDLTFQLNLLDGNKPKNCEKWRNIFDGFVFSVIDPSFKLLNVEKKKKNLPLNFDLLLDRIIYNKYGNYIFC